MTFLYLSAFFEATRDEYYKQLYNVSAKGSWTEWLIYFLNGVALQAEDVLSRAERINELLSFWKLQVASSASQTALKIVEQFSVNPYLTIKKISEALNMPYNTAQRGIKKLEAAQIIKWVDTNKRERLYCATGILDILEEPTKITSDFN